MGIKVVKFGGSSLADAGQFEKVAAIIRSDDKRKYVIPSAPGKRYDGDTKITDMLYKCHELTENGNIEKTFSEIKLRYNQIISDLCLNLSLENEYKQIEDNLKSGGSKDYAASRGEYLNGIILAEYLGFTFIDAAEIIVFNNDGSFLLDETIKKIRKKIKNISHAVIPGFYGMKKNGAVKTFSRGGSDITGSIIARAVNAEIYENWTDVSGFLVADPRIVDNPEVISAITYRELRELSYMGATVLHEDAIFPVRASGIPINIRNTNCPDEKGTLIISDSDVEEIPKYTITGIAGKKGFASINIEKAMMNGEVGFCCTVLKVLQDNNICFEHMPSGIDTMSIILSEAAIEGRENLIASQIKKAAGADNVEIERGLALIAIVGRGMRKTRGTAGRIFAALAHAGINVVMIDQGSSELNIIIGVTHNDFEKATRCIYDMFILSN